MSVHLAGGAAFQHALSGQASSTNSTMHLDK